MRHGAVVAGMFALLWAGGVSPRASQAATAAIPAPGQDPDGGGGVTTPAFILEMDPVAGMTTTRHPVPASGRFPLPAGKGLTLRATRLIGFGTRTVNFLWQGARENTDDGTVSTASFGPRLPGEYPVTVTPLVGGVPQAPLRVTIVVSATQPQNVTVRMAAPAADFVTFVGNPFTCAATTEPPEYADALEWDAPQHAPTRGTGSSFIVRRSVIGDTFPITARLAATAAPPSVSPMIYEAQWVRYPSVEEHFYAPTVRLCYEARTNPPGYEARIRWTFHTKNMHPFTPATGAGPVFIVTATHMKPDRFWREVRGDNLLLGGDIPGGPDCTPEQKRKDQKPKRPDCPPDPPGLSLVSHSLPVGLYNGEASLSVTDLRVKSRGFDFVWERNYSSRADFAGELGANWDHRYMRKVTVLPDNNVSVTEGTGREDVYLRSGINPTVFLSPAGFFDALTENPGIGFTQVMPDRMTYGYRTDGFLTSITDRHGNTQTITRNPAGRITSIEDTQGRLYTFLYDGSGRIQSFTDFAGRQVVYTYDANNDLIRVRSPMVTGMPQPENNFPSGKTTLYSYTSGHAQPELNHNLVKVVEPLYNVGNDPGASKAWVTLAYHTTTNPASVDFDRVRTERWGHDAGGPPGNPAVVVGGASTFAYTLDFTGDPHDPPGAFQKTTETDRNGNITKHYFDITRHPIRTVELMNRNVRAGEAAFAPYITDCTYTMEGLVATKTYPRGNSVSYVYDETNPIGYMRGNLQVEVRKDEALGTGADLITVRTYEPVFNQIRTVTDPRAFPTGNIPVVDDGTGHLHLDLADPLVARYTTMHFFDYQEDAGFQGSLTPPIPVTERIPEGLGDLNGDGITNVDKGNVVKVQLPAIQTGPDAGQTAAVLKAWNAAGQLLAETDPEGTVTAYEYFPTNGTPNDPSDREGYLRFRRVDSTGFNLTTEYAYDLQGNVTREIDPRGADTLYTVNQLNQVVRTFSRAVNGGIRYQVDQIWNANDDLVERRVANLDENGVSYPNDTLTESFEYNILHFPVSQTREKTRNDGSQAGNVRTEYFYDANLNRTAVKSPLAVSGVQPDNIVTTLYDERDLAYKAIRGDTDTDPTTIPALAAVETMNYDANGNLIERIDTILHTVNPAAPTTLFPGSAAGDVTVFGYDGFDRRVLTEDGEGNEYRTAYDLAGNRTQETLHGPDDDPQGAAQFRLLKQTDRTFDERNRRMTETRAHFQTKTGNAIGDGQSVSTWNHDRDGKATVVTDDRSLTTTTIWDTADRVAKVRDHLGNETEYGYDNNGNVTTETRRETSTDLGTGLETYVTTHEYDGLDRLKKTTDPAGNVREFFYDSRDNIVKTSDGVRGSGHPNGPGNTVLMDYDGLDRLIETHRIITTNGRGDGAPVPTQEIVTTQSWDDNSRLVGQTDDNGHATGYGYDAVNRKTSEALADGEAWGWLYDTDNQNTQWTDPNGTTCLQMFDGIGRLVDKAIVLGPGVVGTTFERIGFDGASRATRIEGNDILGNTLTCRFEFDSLDNTTKDQNAGTVDSVHDGVGNRTQVTYPGEIGGPGRRVLGIAYDNLNRMQSVSDGVEPIATWHYKGPARVERRTYGPDAAPISFVDCLYDAYPREVVKHHMTGAGGMIARFEYGYDREHHRLFEKRVHDGNLGDVYQYDSVYRVTRNPQNVNLAAVPAGTEILSETFASPDELAYAYDGVQNRTTSTKTVASVPTVTTYALQAGPPPRDAEVNQYTQTQEGASPAVGYTYDDNGNLTSDGVRLFKYDFKNRLVEVRLVAGNVLVAQYSFDVANRRLMKILPGGTTVYAYDGIQCVEERDAGGISRQYVWGPGIDELLQQQTPTATYYAHENSIGSVCALTDSAGNVVERYQYDPFGNTTVTLNGNTGNRYRFHAAYFDDETGLIHMRNRAYHPWLGRFIQRDPIGIWEDGGNYGNGVAFVANQPINLVDPEGYAPLPALPEGTDISGTDYRSEAEKKLGRPLSKEENEQLYQGCIGLCSNRLDRQGAPPGAFPEQFLRTSCWQDRTQAEAAGQKCKKSLYTLFAVQILIPDPQHGPSESGEIKDPSNYKKRDVGQRFNYATWNSGQNTWDWFNRGGPPDSQRYRSRSKLPESYDPAGTKKFTTYYCIQCVCK